mgnify:CR=1 FL=1
MALPLLLIVVGVLLHHLRVLYRSPLHLRKQRYHPYGYVYFYKGKYEPLPMVKIGKASHNRLVARLKEQRTANPFGLHVYAVIRIRNHHRVERYLHNKFANLRVSKRNEWFWLSPYLWLYIRLVSDKKLTRKTRKALTPR